VNRMHNKHWLIFGGRLNHGTIEPIRSFHVFRVPLGFENHALRRAFRG
jgi:hypothetical protein